MRKLSVFTLCVMLLTLALRAQDTTTLLRVGNENISKSEFLTMYGKNAELAGNQSSQDMRDYLDLFINYKLKLLQAKEMGLDTTTAYLDEVAKYRKQVTEPYLNDRKVTDSLIQEAYDRSKEFVRASHILISLPQNATPADTLAAYKKALSIREKALKGEDFATLAMQYSDDPSAKGRGASDGRPASKGNGGDLGYFTSMVMIYPFESACYALKEGEVSMPVRTSFGYHIIKLTKRIPAYFQTVDVKHIWIDKDKHTPQEAERLINEAYSHISEWGMDSVARTYSEDNYSAAKGGWLIKQKVNSIPAEYIDSMAHMSNGDITKPFLTRFGWHIMKLENTTPLPSLESERSNIFRRISKDSRSYQTIESFGAKAKEEYNFREDKTALEEFKKTVNDSVFAGTWQIPENYEGKKVVFSIGDTSFTQRVLADELYSQQRKQTPSYLPTYLDKFYSDVVLAKVVDYADSRLEDKYPDLKATMDEFRDGVLIFAITDKMVWNKSITDSIGLEKFYQQNKDRYTWGERADVVIWTVDTSIDLSKAVKLITKYNRKGKTVEETKEALLKKFSITEKPAKYFMSLWKRYEKGDNRQIDKYIWNTDLAKDLKAKNKVFTDTTRATNKNDVIVFKQFLEPATKTLSECKGIATSEYQNVLEKNWLEELRNRYSWSVNWDVFNSIK